MTDPTPEPELCTQGVPYDEHPDGKCFLDEPDLQRIVEEMAPAEPRCATCQHWKKRPHPQDPWGACARLSDAPNVWIMAQYGHETWVHTLPDFGCVLHENVITS